MGILTNLVEKVGMRSLKVKQASPEILIVAGVIGVIGGTVLACKATTKAEKILDERRKEIEDIEEVYEEQEDYTEEDKQHDIKIVRAKAAMDIGKSYAPAACIITASVMCIFGSHKILKERNVALAAAYGVLDRSFKKYRERVKNELGDNIDQHFLHGAEDATIEEKVVDEETGKTKKTKKKVTAIPSDVSMYGIWFSHKTSNQWEHNRDYNKMYISNCQQMFNEKLKSRGYVFLSEIYAKLGLIDFLDPDKDADIIKAIQCVGWLRDGNGDGYIDFGLFGGSVVEDRGDYFAIRKEFNEDHIDDCDFFLDFNVDGPILNYI